MASNVLVGTQNQTKHHSEHSSTAACLLSTELSGTHTRYPSFHCLSVQAHTYHVVLLR